MPDSGVFSASNLYKEGSFIFDCFFTQSQKMADCLRLAKHAAGCELAVMIAGESGTGKNLLAQAIHNASDRKKANFIPVNMSSLSDTLIQSELFGHEKGAFTGADRQMKGKFELAHGGTLVLDEIGDMSMPAQPKILHAVEYKQFHRVGGEVEIHADVRLISMTNRNLDQLVEEKKFRLDLLYRLREITIEIPPLRERREDIPLLANALREHYDKSDQMAGRQTGTFTKAAMAAMAGYTWPGNLRELKSVVRRSIVLSMGEDIEVTHLGLPGTAASSPPPLQSIEASEQLTLAEAERRHIMKTLSFLNGNKRQAARSLNISRTTLDRKIELYQLG